MKRFFPYFGGFIALTAANWAHACPLCHSNTADEVRAGISATAQDGSVFLALFGPFIALSVVLSLLNRFTPEEFIAKKERNEK